MCKEPYLGISVYGWSPIKLVKLAVHRNPSAKLNELNEEAISKQGSPTESFIVNYTIEFLERFIDTLKLWTVYLLTYKTLEQIFASYNLCKPQNFPFAISRLHCSTLHNCPLTIVHSSITVKCYLALFWRTSTYVAVP